MTARLSQVLLLLGPKFYYACGQVLSPTSEASRDSPDFFLVLIICAIVCFALRHANDFYAGETITLVEEGVFSGRFRHKVEHRMLTTIEKDFSDMYEQLKDKEAVATDPESVDES